MRNAIRRFFDEKKIEYYSVLDYRDTRLLNAEILEREGFAPKSAILFLVPYYAGEGVNLSRYATSLDYHIILRALGEELITVLKAHAPSARYKIYGDHSPIDERHAALVAGLGILGDNGLLINEKYGSYIFVADLITDIEPEVLGAVSPQPIRHCEGCGICRAACPTGILSGRGEDCLSAITQRKGELREDEISLMRKYNTAWGCDECQCHCPHNLNPIKTPISFFYEERVPELTLDLLDSLDKAGLRRRAFGWRGRSVPERNLKILDEKG